ncbi:MAG: hypothetical protein LBG60_04930 [Bifidobacteriaceae bacterium]|jgi:hypothetical protein|nr:hypothetical protein [Bifidobacteriaceae bacterium]
MMADERVVIELTADEFRALIGLAKLGAGPAVELMQAGSVSADELDFALRVVEKLDAGSGKWLRTRLPQ